MKKTTLIYSFLTILFLSFLAFIPAQAQITGDKHSIKPTKFTRLMKKENTVVIDVRTSEEFKEGHIPGAVNIDVKNDAFKSNIKVLDKSKTYLLYCKTARRSATALNLMHEDGFKKVKHLKGGIENWRVKKE